MITQYAFAKLNFNLHVLPKLLPNGYHRVNFLNLQADLSDKITVQKIKQGIEFFCDNPNLTDNEANLAYKAAKLVMENSHPRGGIKITLEKNIPITSGLGGGSADAAAVILALDKLWKLNLSDAQKIELANKLGKDVCYSVIGGTCLISGAGEIIELQDFSFPGINLIIVTPNEQKLSTGWAYKLLDSVKVGEHLEKLDKIIEAIKKKDLHSVALNLHNDFEKVIFLEFPKVAEIKAKMMKNGALGAILAGSGLSVFGIWKDQKSAKLAFKALKKFYPQTFLTKTI